MCSKITCMTVNVYFRSCCWRLLDEITGWAVTACYSGDCYYGDCYYGDCYTEVVILRLFPFLSHYILNRSYSFVLVNIFVQSIRYSIDTLLNRYVTQSIRFLFMSSYSLFLASVSITSITIYPVISYLLLFFTLSYRCCLLFLNFPFFIFYNVREW